MWYLCYYTGKGKGRRGKGERDHEQMEDAHKEDSFRALMVSIARLTNSLATIAATVLASNPGWLLPAVSIWKETTWIQSSLLTLLWINTSECLISCTIVSILSKKKYFIAPTKISLLFLSDLYKANARFRKLFNKLRDNRDYCQHFA